METSRRNFIRLAGGTSIAVLTLTSLTGLVTACSKQEAEVLGEDKEPVQEPVQVPEIDYAAVPWPYQQIDPVAAAERAYTGYYVGGCMYGGFEGIIGELRKSVGGPYDKFPSAMMKYGGGGVDGWGTLCGACNGPAAAIALVTDPETRKKIISDLFAWYGQEALPNYKPQTPKYDNIVTSVADSQLCHVSVTKWSEASGFKTNSPERSERCGWITASVVKKAVELLNSAAAGTFSAAYGLPVSVTGCLSCHGKGGAVENVHIAKHTSCTDCHSDLNTKHPIPLS